MRYPTVELELNPRPLAVGAGRWYKSAAVVGPKTVFTNRWEIEAPLARGSTSEVFRGHDRATGEPVALKVLQSDYAQNGDAVKRFSREGRVAQELRHPRIVAVRDYGVEGDRPWIAMELLEGETLEARLARERVSVPDVLALTEQVGEALDHAHAHDVIHRDVKPDNCFVLAGCDTFTVKVLDFGFARLAGTRTDGLQTAYNALLGTPLYMAPEQIRSSRDVDRRADLWSLAVMVYELMVGAPPFDAKNSADLFVEIMSRPIDRPSGRNPALGESVDRWFARALDRDPERRFQSGAELARSLRAAVGGDATGLPTWPPPSPSMPPSATASPRPTSVRARPVTEKKLPVARPGAVTVKVPTVSAARKRSPVWAWALGVALAVAALALVALRLR